MSRVLKPHFSQTTREMGHPGMDIMGRRVSSFQAKVSREPVHCNPEHNTGVAGSYHGGEVSV